ncbi:MAG: hypothetical protein KGV43_00535 [Arcobacter sp.]|nr:hypothetical protein [Arcobacter sp.]
MSENIEVRKLPKRTIITILILIILGLMSFFLLKALKEEKMSEILFSLKHKNIKDIQVINKLSVEDKKTKYKSTVYKVKFFDKNTNKICIGFIHLKRDNTYSEDLDCK